MIPFCCTTAMLAVYTEVHRDVHRLADDLMWDETARQGIFQAVVEEDL